MGSYERASALLSRLNTDADPSSRALIEERLRARGCTPPNSPRLLELKERSKVPVSQATRDESRSRPAPTTASPKTSDSSSTEKSPCPSSSASSALSHPRRTAQLPKSFCPRVPARRRKGDLCSNQLPTRELSKAYQEFQGIVGDKKYWSGYAEESLRLVPGVLAVKGDRAVARSGDGPAFRDGVLAFADNLIPQAAKFWWVLG